MICVWSRQNYGAASEVNTEFNPVGLHAMQKVHLLWEALINSNFRHALVGLSDSSIAMLCRLITLFVLALASFEATFPIVTNVRILSKLFCADVTIHVVDMGKVS